MSERDRDNSNSDELLSAYQDGEVSAEERLRLEAELRSSPEKQEVLRQYVELSGWLKDLPREELSVDLRPEVMQRIENSDEVPVAAPTALPSRSSSARRMWQWGVSFSSVAALLLFLWLVNTPDRRGNSVTEGLDGSVAMKSPVAPQIAREKVADEMKVAAKPAPGAAAYSVQNTTAGKAPADHRRLVEQEIELGTAGEFPGSASGGTIASTEDATQYSFSQDISKLQPGQVVRALEHAGDKVSVVTLSVVDRDQALDTLRIVLAKQAVPDEDDAKLNLKMSGGGLGGANMAGKKETREYSEKDFPLIAVYVQATGGQLEAAIKELKAQEQQFLALDVESQLPEKEVEQLVEEKELPLVADKEQSPGNPKDAPASEKAKPNLAKTDKSPDSSPGRKRPATDGDGQKTLTDLLREGMVKKKLEEQMTAKVSAPSQASRQRSVQLKQLPAQTQAGKFAVLGVAPTQQNQKVAGTKNAPELRSTPAPGLDVKGVTPAPAVAEKKNQPVEGKEGEQRDSKSAPEALARKDSPEKPLQVLFVLRQRAEQSAPISKPDDPQKK
ncbi:MAG: hypothetical protein U0903_04420 [Planctomycetales bacterium]